MTQRPKPKSTEKTKVRGESMKYGRGWFGRLKHGWNVKDSRKNMKLFDKELERLHKLLLSEVDYDLYKEGIEDEIKKIHDHMLTVSKRIAGLEY